MNAKTMSKWDERMSRPSVQNKSLWKEGINHSEVPWASYCLPWALIPAHRGWSNFCAFLKDSPCRNALHLPMRYDSGPSTPISLVLPSPICHQVSHKCNPYWLCVHFPRHWWSITNKKWRKKWIISPALINLYPLIYFCLFIKATAVCLK